MRKIIRIFQILIFIGMLATTFIESVWPVTIPIGFSSILGFELLNRMYIK